MRSIIFGLAMLAMGSTAFGLPEASLGTRQNARILEVLARTSFSPEKAKLELSETAIPVLDSLWKSGVSYKTAAGLYLTRFEGRSSRHPVVILPGFTEYRKQYLEFIVDLEAQGYGPFYVLDFRSHGQSFKPFLKAGEVLPSMKTFLAGQGDKVKDAFENRLSAVGNQTKRVATVDQLRSVVTSLDVGLGDGSSYFEFAADVDAAMGFAKADLEKRGNRQKITAIAHSTGGMALLVALGHYTGGWIKSLERVILMVPLIGVQIKQGGRVIPSPLIEIVQDVALTPFRGEQPAYGDRGVEQFVNKTLGIFDPENSVSHSINRLTLSDSLRVWNGFETVGGTRRWVSAMLDTEYRPHDLISKQILNRQMNAVRAQLAANGIDPVIVSAGADTIAKTSATAAYARSLSRRGVQTKYCNIDGARHVIHQEADEYRQPFVRLMGSFIGAARVTSADQKKLNCVVFRR